MKNRNWMYGDRRDNTYINGVREFCNAALEHKRNTGQAAMYCPCCDCGNSRKLVDIDKIEEHLFRRGFTTKYETWYLHGEELSFIDNDNEVRVTEDNESNCNDDMFNMGEEQINDMFNTIGDRTINENPRMFEDVSKAAETPLYPGCRKYSKLSGILTLANLKAKYGWTDTSFTSLLETLADMFPDGNELPKSTFLAKKMINPLGLEYIKIHACPNDCVLYRKEYENLDTCPICGKSRYLRKEGAQAGKKSPPAKVLRYLPIIPRFTRLFSIKEDAKNLVWHEEERKKDGLIRHPADSKQWAEINQKFPIFGNEPRNLRLGLSTDGMNPYGTLSSIHSTWPVLLTIYNLPPWLCMKRKYIMLTLLISGPKQPGNDIDVYLAPLIDDLKQLWDEGVSLYDAHTGSNFTLRAMIFCTINDFPAYGNLSGYKVRGEKACPVCEDDMKPQYLTFSGKNVYLHTRRFLRRSHPYRQMKARFGGNVEEEVAREPLSGIETFERVKDITPIYGKHVKSKSNKAIRWKKKSIFWDLPYWKHLSVRHCLDVMHIEKNVCDSLLGTLLDTSNKTKDGLKVRRDMEKLNIHPNLWPEYSPDKSKAYLPKASYTLSKDEKRKFIECLHDVKVPTGYSSNVRRFVSLAEKTLIGMKSHDHHVFMQVFLPIALRGMLAKNIRQAIVKLSVFFAMICRKVIDPNELDSMQHDVVETLCKFEMYFPPSFFDIMVHLIIHLVREVKECGPVFLRWMYPMERYMGVLKRYVKNRARPEGSIVERYMAEEASEFCAVFFDVANKDIGISKTRHEGRLLGIGTIGRNEIRCPGDLFNKAHFCVLQHLSDVHPYLQRHLNVLRAGNPKCSQYALQVEHTKTFVKWFQNQVYLDLQEPTNNVSPTIASLSRGPQPFVNTFQGYDINGYCFYTKLQDDKSVHQNSSIMVEASSIEYSSARDKRPVIATLGYYGVIQEIWELDYLEFRMPVFKCKWVDGTAVKLSDDGMSLVDSRRFKDTKEPFILASQAKQIFYIKDNIDPHWLVVVQGKRKIVGVEDVVDEVDYDQFDPTPPLSTLGIQSLPSGEDDEDDVVYSRDEGTYVDL